VRTIRCLPRGLKEQGSGTFADIELARYGPFLPVPYWDWMDRHEDAARILAKDGDTEDLKFVRPLLRDVLRDCTCIISGTQLEISLARETLVRLPAQFGDGWHNDRNRPSNVGASRPCLVRNRRKWMAIRNPPQTFGLAKPVRVLGL
jgi:hypothetical protein